MCVQYNLEYYLELAEHLVGHGIHALGIKDMAGLLKPRAAAPLMQAIREVRREAPYPYPSLTVPCGTSA
jgi:pyruvate carboxylase